MKILVICQYYHPEPFRISDICEELVRMGNEVTVVTGTPNYPMGNIYEGYENGAHRDEVINGVSVHRCAIHPRKTGALHRLWNYFSFANASKKYIKSLDGSFDVVFVNQLSPVMMAKAGIKYAKRHNKKTVLYCLDLWPASLGVGGINKGIVYKYFHGLSRKIYGAADKILISSKSFSKYFEEQFGICDTEYLPQYAEESFTPDDCKKTENEYIDLMFAGNVGTAQSVDTVIRASVLCKDIERVRWHIVGDGKELDGCIKLAKETDAPVIFHGRKPIEEMPKYYAMADAMLVTMKKDPIVGLTLPGKVQSYMAAGKAILGAADGEARRVIEESRCGFCTEAENAEGLAECVRRFMLSKKDGFEKSSAEYYENNYTKKRFATKLQEVLNEQSS